MLSRKRNNRVVFPIPGGAIIEVKPRLFWKPYSSEASASRCVWLGSQHRGSGVAPKGSSRKPKYRNNILLLSAPRQCSKHRHAQVAGQLIRRAERWIHEVEHECSGKTEGSGQEQRKEGNAQRGPFGKRRNDRLLSEGNVQNAALVKSVTDARFFTLVLI